MTLQYWLQRSNQQVTMSKNHERKGLFLLRTQTSGVSRFILESSGQIIQASKMGLQYRNNQYRSEEDKLEVWGKF